MSHLIPCAARSRLVVTALVAFAAIRCSDGPTAPPPPPVPTLTIACPSASPVQSTDDNPVVVTFGPAVASGGLAPVTATCTPASGSEFPVGSTTVICTAVDGRGVSAICSFPVVVNPPPRLTLTRFLAFGDSITWGVDSPPVPTSSPSFAYPEQLRQRLAARYRFQTPEVINEGNPAEFAQAALPRLRRVLQTSRHDVLLLMEGTNDLLFGLPAIDDVIVALREMIQEARAQGVAVALATVTPQRPEIRPAAALVPILNDRIRVLAMAENVVLVDVHERMKDDLSLIGIDGLHPTVRGFEVMADVFFAAIQANFEVKPISQAGVRSR